MWGPWLRKPSAMEGCHHLDSRRPISLKLAVLMTDETNFTIANNNFDCKIAAENQQNRCLMTSAFWQLQKEPNSFSSIPLAELMTLPPTRYWVPSLIPTLSNSYPLYALWDSAFQFLQFFDNFTPASWGSGSKFSSDGSERPHDVYNMTLMTLSS